MKKRKREEEQSKQTEQAAQTKQVPLTILARSGALDNFLEKSGLNVDENPFSQMQLTTKASLELEPYIRELESAYEIRTLDSIKSGLDAWLKGVVFSDSIGSTLSKSSLEYGWFSSVVDILLSNGNHFKNQGKPLDAFKFYTKALEITNMVPIKKSYGSKTSTPFEEHTRLKHQVVILNEIIANCAKINLQGKIEPTLPFDMSFVYRCMSIAFDTHETLKRKGGYESFNLDSSCSEALMQLGLVSKHMLADPSTHIKVSLSFCLGAVKVMEDQVFFREGSYEHMDILAYQKMLDKFASLLESTPDIVERIPDIRLMVNDLRLQILCCSEENIKKHGIKQLVISNQRNYDFYTDEEAASVYVSSSASSSSDSSASSSVSSSASSSSDSSASSSSDSSASSSVSSSASTGVDSLTSIGSPDFYSYFSSSGSTSSSASSSSSSSASSSSDSSASSSANLSGESVEHLSFLE